MVKLLPTIMIGLSAAASGVYFYHDPTDWRRWGYWAAAAFLNFCVTY